MAMDIKMPVDVACEDMLADKCTFCGWLRKETSILRMQRWPKTYCVVHDRCFYYFKNEKSKKASGKFPLYGFNKIKRNIDKSVKWCFILEPMHQEQKSYKFSAASPQEMVEWMKYIKEEMLRANNREPRNTADGSSDGSNHSFKQDSMEEIEERIYDDLDSVKPVDISDSDDSDLDSYESETESAETKVPMLPNLPRIIPGEGQRRRKVGYENVELVAGSATKTPSNTKLSTETKTEKDYWKSIYFDGDREEANRIIEDIAMEGVFLVRQSESANAPMVLVTYSTERKSAVKFKIFKQETDSIPQYYLKTEPKFETVEELIYYYIHESINEDDAKLTVPWLLAQDRS